MYLELQYPGAALACIPEDILAIGLSDGMKLY